MNIPAELQHYRQRLESLLTAQLGGDHSASSGLDEAIQYATLGHGKRLRPMLVYATVEAFGSDIALGDAPACAVELIHTYSLVHDDLPAMDDDGLRHGKASCHIAYDEATAILVGDALQALAFQVLSSNPHLAAEQRLAMINELSYACGAQGMAGGQMLDMAATGIPQTLESMETIHHLKTGALLMACVKMGALAANINEPSILGQLTEFAHYLGLAFQIQDDILDIEISADTMGKPQGSDAAMNKSTYTSLSGVDSAKQRVHSLYDQAFTLLDTLDNKTTALKSITLALKNRSF